ncbi:MAG: alpha/beta hydrolase-fold protein [Terriglobia bacterium]|nr:alpha/beta hydrolase-fold protein [Terriglobia bacterium]
MSRRLRRLSVILSLLFSVNLLAQTSGPLRFEVSLDPALSSSATSGRLIVFMTNDPMPRQVIGQHFGEPETVKTWVTAREVPHLAPGETVELDPNEIAYPEAFAKVPAGNYQVMALLDVDHNAAYNLFTDADLRSAVVQLKALNPAQAGPVDLKLSLHVPQMAAIDLPKGDEMIDFVSPSLTKFWGRPIHMRGIVVLPPKYATSKGRYPTVYLTHGFGANINYLAKEFGESLPKEMADGELPPMIYVLLDESCPGGTHEFADSVNNGPWGHALTTELIPYLEHKYRMDARPSGRFLTGHSSGGWATMWMQVAYPKVFGGTWSTSPDPVDFRDFTNIDLTKDSNVYTRPDGTSTPLVRMDGKEVESFEQYSKEEAVLGAYGGQISSFDWVFSPRGKDGRPEPMFDRSTGEIHHNVADYWLKHYDIARILADNSKQLAPELKNKIHIIVGTADTFYLDGAIHLLQKRIAGLGYSAKFTYLPGRTHFDLYKGGLETRIAEQMYDVARPGNHWKPSKAPSAATELAK